LNHHTPSGWSPPVTQDVEEVAGGTGILVLVSGPVEVDPPAVTSMKFTSYSVQSSSW